MVIAIIVEDFSDNEMGNPLLLGLIAPAFITPVAKY